MNKLFKRFFRFNSKRPLEAYGFNAKGEVFIYKEVNNQWELILHKANAIQPIHKDIVAERLAENNLVRIDQIELLNGALSLSIRNISERVVTNGNEVTFNAIFEEASFNGAFTQGKLISSAKGAFSIITGLSLSKTTTEKIMISWKITVL